MMQAVAYARFSSENQRSESIDAQLRAIESYCKTNGIKLLKNYIDKAKSATTDNRPAFQQMIEDAEAKQFQMVIVHKLDRFSRNRKDSIVYKALLKNYGIEVVSVSEPLSHSPESVILESVLEGMAEYYSLNLSREVKKGLKENALQCKFTGGRPPLGYDVDKETKKLVINSTEADAVRYIFNAVLEGKGYNGIIKELNQRGYKTKTNNNFAKNSLFSILRNEKYKGVYSFSMDVGKDMTKRRKSRASKSANDVIRIENGVPAIVSVEVFAKVQKILDDRRNAKQSLNAKEVYLLSGKVKCGECGASYCGSRKYSGRNKKLHVTYRCNGRVMKTTQACQNTEINRDTLENCVLKVLSDVIFDKERIPQIVESYNKEIKAHFKENHAMICGMEKNLMKTKGKIDNLVDVIAATGNRVLVEKLELLEEERQVLEQQIHMEKQKIKEIHINNETITLGFNRAKRLFLSGELEDMRSLINLYLQNVVVYRDHIDIRANALPGSNLDLDIPGGLDVHVSLEKKDVINYKK